MSQTEQQICWIGTIHVTYKTGDTVYDDSDNAYVAIGPSEWTEPSEDHSGGYYETPCLPKRKEAQSC